MGNSNTKTTKNQILIKRGSTLAVVRNAGSKTPAVEWLSTTDKPDEERLALLLLIESMYENEVQK